MATQPMLDQRWTSTATTGVSGHLRLAACPQCGGRSRALAEASGRLLGRCLSCASTLPAPLLTERRAAITLVGRPQRRGWS